MTIDVIIPAYNAERTLRTAVQSALACPFARVILVDDGSTDGTPALCDELAADPRVTALHQKNSGVSAARNAGIAAATAEWVALLDADDTLLDGALAALCRVEADAVQGRVVRRTEKADFRSVPRCMPARAALEIALSDPTNHLHTHGWVFRRTLLTEPFDPALTLGEDGEWMLRTLLHAQTAAFLDTPVYHYALRPDSVLHGGGNGVCAAYMQTLRAAKLSLDRAELPRAAALYRLTHLLLALTHGDFREGMALREDEMFREAFRTAELRGHSPRIWALRFLKWRCTPLVRLCVMIRRHMNRQAP